MSNLEYRADQFIDELVIKHGPEDLLARFFLKAADAAAQRGVYLEFGTFADLLQVNVANKDSWLPLTSTFREDLGGASDECGIVILGRNLAGEVVATQAVRRFDWHNTNFKVEAESLRIFYADPERDSARNESCIVTAPSAPEISGCVALGGGIWYRPDYRALQLSQIITRIGRAYALAQWNYSWMIATITQNNLKTKFDRRAGYRDVEPASIVMRNSTTLPDGDLHLALARMTCMQLIDDVFGFLMDFDTQVDARVANRRAQQ